MSIITTGPKPAFYAGELFSVDVLIRRRSTKITMKVFTSLISTENVPSTYTLLKKHLPSILRSKCFNENNYKFSKEVKNTEIGHLFEHIILENLSSCKSALGFNNPVYNGLTRWNWARDARGVFHIEIDSGLDEEEIFALALNKSTELLNIILQSATLDNSVYHPTPAINQFSFAEAPLED